MDSTRRGFYQRMNRYARRRRLVTVITSDATSDSEVSGFDTVGEVSSLSEDVSASMPANSLTETPVQTDFVVEEAVRPVPVPADTSDSESSELESSESDRLSDSRLVLPADEGLFSTNALASFRREPGDGLGQIRRWLNEKQSRVWMFVGDETTAWMRYRGQPGYAEIFRHRLRWELKRSADLVINAGLEKATLADLHQVALQGLKQRHVDALFIMPGWADLSFLSQRPHHYARQLTDLVRLLRSHQVEPVLQTPPLPHRLVSNRLLAQISQQADLIREVSLTEQVPLLDHAEFWTENPVHPGWYKPQRGSLSQAGQLVLSFLFLTELDIYDRKSSLCQRILQAWPKPDQQPDQPASSETALNSESRLNSESMVLSKPADVVRAGSAEEESEGVSVS